LIHQSHGTRETSKVISRYKMARHDGHVSNKAVATGAWEGHPSGTLQGYVPGPHTAEGLGTISLKRSDA
jgi:hypothetical protein